VETGGCAFVAVTGVLAFFALGNGPELFGCDSVLLGLLPLLLLLLDDNSVDCSPEPWLWDLPFGAPELGGRRDAVEEAGAV